ncbi:hypothetical protein [Mycolicibacterium sp. CR10]|nr:hypothetical protein [Mycolicibacterium sp. CR10]
MYRSRVADLYLVALWLERPAARDKGLRVHPYSFAIAAARSTG